jgi:hypothetical protein
MLSGKLIHAFSASDKKLQVAAAVSTGHWRGWDCTKIYSNSYTK